MLAKSKLETIKVLISKDLMDLYINHDKFILIKNVLKGYNKILYKNNGNVLCRL